MSNKIIRYRAGGLADAVDALRDTLGELAGPGLVSRFPNPERFNSYWLGHRQHLYWEGQKLNTRGLEMLLGQLGIEFRNEKNQPIRLPRLVARVFLTVAADYCWFSANDGEWMRKNNPPG